MSVTTASRYGAHYSEAVQADILHGWVSGAEFDGEAMNAVVEAMFDELVDEVNARLPEGACWRPATSEFIHDIESEMPSSEEMRELFDAAHAAVYDRYWEIEQRVLGTLPSTADLLVRELRRIGDPIHRARVAGMLVDPATCQRVAEVRAEAIYEATRTRTREEVADRLGTGVAAIGKAVREHNRRLARNA